MSHEHDRGCATHEFVGVVFHSILHYQDENVGALSDFLCGIFAHHKTDNAAPGNMTLIKRRPGAYRLGDCPGTGTEPKQPGRCPLFVLATLESKARSCASLGQVRA
jgi:hypothetical protein